MPDERDQDDASSRLLIAARAFLEFATTSPIDEPDRLLKLIRLLDALNAAVIEIRTPIPADDLDDGPDEPSEPSPDRWPELHACYPSALQFEDDPSDENRQPLFASAYDDLRGICGEIREGLSIADHFDEQTAAEHLAWTCEAHWIWHAHGLRYFLAKRLFKQP